MLNCGLCRIQIFQVKFSFRECSTFFTLLEKCPNTEFFWSIFSRFRTECRDLLRKSPSSVRIWENTDQKKLCIWTLFTQCHLMTKFPKIEFKYVSLYLFEFKILLILLKTKAAVHRRFSRELF